MGRKLMFNTVIASIAKQSIEVDARLDCFGAFGKLPPLRNDTGCIEA
jgi:hypothetical protein